jgi:hypothetical protein
VSGRGNDPKKVLWPHTEKIFHNCAKENYTAISFTCKIERRNNTKNSHNWHFRHAKTKWAAAASCGPAKTCCGGGMCCSQWGRLLHLPLLHLHPRPQQHLAHPFTWCTTTIIRVNLSSAWVALMVRMVSSHGGDTRPSTLWRIYVMATSVSPRNRPNPNKCGICYEVMCSTLKPVHITAIDMCAPSPTGGMHFDGQCPVYRWDRIRYRLRGCIVQLSGKQRLSNMYLISIYIVM